MIELWLPRPCPPLPRRAQVDDTMEDIREQMDIAQEIGEAVSQPVGFGLDFDDEDLEAELEDLEQVWLDGEFFFFFFFFFFLLFPRLFPWRPGRLPAGVTLPPRAPADTPLPPFPPSPSLPSRRR